MTFRDLANVTDVTDVDLELSSSTLKALTEFLAEQQSGQKSQDEDWQLSQFWYSKETSVRLTREILENTNSGDMIACISSPTAFKEFLSIDNLDRKVFLLEFDSRFQIYDNFIQYDYNDPLNLPRELLGKIDYILVDPPFLSIECWTKVSSTVKSLLSKNGKICACTGAIMKEFLARELMTLETDYSPCHTGGLQNEFKAFINYNSKSLKLI